MECPVRCEAYSDFREAKSAPCTHTCCDICWAKIIWHGGKCPFCRAAVHDWIQEKCGDCIVAPADAIGTKEICDYMQATINERPQDDVIESRAIQAYVETAFPYDAATRAYIEAAVPNAGPLRELAERILRNIPRGVHNAA